MTLGCTVAILFLSISTYFCIHRRPNNHHGSIANTSNYCTTTPSLGCNSSNSKITVRENNVLPKNTENPDMIPIQQQNIAALPKGNQKRLVISRIEFASLNSFHLSIIQHNLKQSERGQKI